MFGANSTNVSYAKSNFSFLMSKCYSVDICIQITLDDTLANPLWVTGITNVSLTCQISKYKY